MTPLTLKKKFKKLSYRMQTDQRITSKCGRFGCVIQELITLTLVTSQATEVSEIISPTILLSLIQDVMKLYLYC